MVGVFALLIAGGYTLFRSMNRLASNNHYELGLECEMKHDYAGAMYYYAQGMEMDNSNYKVRERLANVLIKSRPEYKESYLQAAYLYASLLPLKEGNKDTLLYKLSNYIQIKEYNKALVSLEEITPSFNDTTLLLKSECYIHNKDWQQALDVLEEFMLKNPQSDLAHQKVGFIYYKNVEFEKAKESLDKAILFNPSNGSSYYLRGLVAIATTDTLDACRDFRTCEELNYEGADRALYKFCNSY
jgi:tetratricopeptide (TPR) repeat protein